jgi:hypothetical protein
LILTAISLVSLISVPFFNTDPLLMPNYEGEKTEEDRDLTEPDPLDCGEGLLTF